MRLRPLEAPCKPRPRHDRGGPDPLDRPRPHLDGIQGAPLLAPIDWAGVQTAAGVTVDGTVFVTSDAGLTWQLRGGVAAQPQAIGAALSNDGDGAARVLVVTSEAVLQSTDGGATFTTLTHGPRSAS